MSARPAAFMPAMAFERILDAVFRDMNSFTMLSTAFTLNSAWHSKDEGESGGCGVQLHGGSGGGGGRRAIDQQPQQQWMGTNGWVGIPARSSTDSTATANAVVGKSEGRREVSGRRRIAGVHTHRHCAADVSRLALPPELRGGTLEAVPVEKVVHQDSDLFERRYGDRRRLHARHRPNYTNRGRPSEPAGRQPSDSLRLSD